MSDDNPDVTIFGMVMNIITLPFHILFWPIKKFMAWAHKGVGE